jgi:hypothetical protein
VRLTGFWGIPLTARGCSEVEQASYALQTITQDGAIYSGHLEGCSDYFGDTFIRRDQLVYILLWILDNGA